jgi:hypothetical protein
VSGYLGGARFNRRIDPAPAPRQAPGSHLAAMALFLHRPRYNEHFGRTRSCKAKAPEPTAAYFAGLPAPFFRLLVETALMKWLTYPALLLLRELGIVGMLRSHYRALKQPGVIQVSRPYLSIADSRMCITLSQTVHVGGMLRVFCCDLDWQDQ